MTKHVRRANYDSDHARDYNRRYHYGVGSAEIEAMLETQGGRCAICRTDNWPGHHHKPHVDHCHDTGQIRGVLCASCNQGLGKFRDSPDLLQAAIAYLQK